MNKLGSFDKLSDLDKLALLGGSGDYNKLKNLDLRKIYKDMGGGFGNKLIKIKIKSQNDQPINHKFSQQLEGKES